MCGTVHDAGRLDPLRRTTAHTISVAPRITNTSPTWSAPATSCSPSASIVPPPSTAPGRPPTPPTAADPTTMRGQRRHVVETGPPCHVFVPSREVEQRQRGHRRRRVDRAHATQRRVGHRLCRPIAGRLGVGGDEGGRNRTSSPELPDPRPWICAGLDLGLGQRTTVVAIQQPVRDGSTRRRRRRTTTAPSPRRSTPRRRCRSRVGRAARRAQLVVHRTRPRPHRGRAHRRGGPTSGEGCGPSPRRGHRHPPPPL